MGARTGKDYLQGLRDDREVWIAGSRVADVTHEPCFTGITRSIAGLYDRQWLDELQDITLFEVEGSDSRAGMAFLFPYSSADLVRRRKAFTAWAEFSGGFLGRSPDFLSTMVTAFAASADYFGRFAGNVRRYYEYCRDYDVCLTHALSGPVSGKTAALQVVDETSEGIVVSGSRALATLAPVADEILIFPGPAPRTLEQEGTDRHAMAFAIPVASKGLKFLCRDSFDDGSSPLDHPLSMRFDEQDAVALFDRVVVPWSRVFLLYDRGLANGLWAETRAFNHAAHQVLAKNIVKAQCVLGVTSLVAAGTAADQHLHVQAMLGEVVDAIETLRAFVRAAEVDAVPGAANTLIPNPDIIDTARNYFPAIYPRLMEILQIIGASGHVAHVSQATLDGPMGALVEEHYKTANLGGRERVQLFKLASDMACSAFAGRQAVYERYFDGDPFRKRAARYGGYRGTDAARRIARDLLQSRQPDAAVVERS